jgi:hypothetical protein
MRKKLMELAEQIENSCSSNYAQRIAQELASAAEYDSNQEVADLAAILGMGRF